MGPLTMAWPTEIRRRIVRDFGEASRRRNSVTGGEDRGGRGGNESGSTILRFISRKLCVVHGNHDEDVGDR